MNLSADKYIKSGMNLFKMRLGSQKSNINNNQRKEPISRWSRQNQNKQKFWLCLKCIKGSAVPLWFVRLSSARRFWQVLTSLTFYHRIVFKSRQKSSKKARIMVGAAASICQNSKPHTDTVVKCYFLTASMKCKSVFDVQDENFVLSITHPHHASKIYKTRLELNIPLDRELFQD